MFDRSSSAFIAILLLAAVTLSCARLDSRHHGESLRAGQRELCEEANSDCALGCGSPDYIDRRLGKEATRDYANTYTKCAAVCGERYQQCLERMDQPVDRLSHAISYGASFRRPFSVSNDRASINS